MRPGPAQLELPGLDGHPLLALSFRLARRSVIALLLLALGWSAASWRFYRSRAVELQAIQRETETRMIDAVEGRARKEEAVAQYERWIGIASQRKAIGGPR